MPPAELLVFREANGRIPVEDWLDSLPTKVRAKCLNYLRLLAASGHELRRPLADLLRDGMHELRPCHQGVHYRILYFFHGRDVVVLSHGVTNTRRVPDTEIRRAARRRQLVLEDPACHLHKLAPEEV